MACCQRGRAKTFCEDDNVAMLDSLRLTAGLALSDTCGSHRTRIVRPPTCSAMLLAAGVDSRHLTNLAAGERVLALPLQGQGWHDGRRVTRPARFVVTPRNVVIHLEV